MYKNVRKVGNDVDTDLIIAARYLNDASEENMRAHVMEDVIPHYSEAIDGGILVAGENFGCGSSREHAPFALKVAGTHCVIAKSFARIFYRNAINIGLPIIACAEAAEDIEDGDKVHIDFEQGTITNQTKHTTYTFPAFPPFIQKLVEAGNLLAFAKQGDIE